MGIGHLQLLGGLTCDPRAGTARAAKSSIAQGSDVSTDGRVSPRQNACMSSADAPSPTAGLPITSVPACGNDSRGTLFVIQGDMSTLHADAVLIPSDSTGWIRDTWSWVWEPGEAPRRRQLVEHMDDLRDRQSAVFPVGVGEKNRTVVVGNTAVPKGSSFGREEAVDWLRAGLRGSLEGYGTWLAENPGSGDRRRALPLLAMPLVGTKGGGLAGIRGRVIGEVLDVIREYQEGPGTGQRPFDVVLVCNEAADYAAVQSIRRSLKPGDLPDWLIPIERSAQAGQLGVMFGAGASIGLGMPNWGDLLGKMIEALGSSSLTMTDLSGLDPVDAASLLVDLAQGLPMTGRRVTPSSRSAWRGS